jgi:uncharacterized protein YdaU (DUF1376 family)
MKIASFSIADYCEATEGMPHDVERLYFRILMKMYSREAGLPDDDRDNARIFGYDIRVYKGLKAKLLNWPDAVRIEGGLMLNGRVEKDIADYKSKRKSAGLPAKISETSGELLPDLSQKSPHISHATNGENNNLAEPSPTPTPSPIESNPLIPPDPYDRCAFVAGELVLRNGLKAFWLDQFGGDEIRLDLALKQAAGYVQENSRRPLEAQVSAQLGRIAGDRHDRDRRVSRTPAVAQTQPFEDWREKRQREQREFLELARSMS